MADDNENNENVEPTNADANNSLPENTASAPGKTQPKGPNDKDEANMAQKENAVKPDLKAKKGKKAAKKDDKEANEGSEHSSKNIINKSVSGTKDEYLKAMMEILAELNDNQSLGGNLPGLVQGIGNLVKKAGQGMMSDGPEQVTDPKSQATTAKDTNENAQDTLGAGAQSPASDPIVAMAPAADTEEPSASLEAAVDGSNDPSSQVAPSPSPGVNAADESNDEEDNSGIQLGQ